MGSLYRKYRPRALSEVVGQNSVIDLLRASLAAGQVSHAYLLAGPHGVGKTSIARILAHEINQLEYHDDSEYLDIIEIDAASNNGVDDIRDLRERVQIAPAHADKKIYIIDEVHMLSKSAFNALLKTLEEPPAHVVFILATTEPDKLPETILSRVQRYNFKQITLSDIISHLKMIAKKEKIAISDEALGVIAEYGHGSFRDSISVLDQIRYLASEHKISADNVRNTLGIANGEIIDKLLDAARANNLAEMIAYIKELENSGSDIRSVVDQLTDKIHATLVDFPQDISLLDALFEVANSNYPYLKLLTALGKPALAIEAEKPAPKKPIPATPESPKPDTKKPTSVAQVATVEKISVAAPTPKAQPTAAKDFTWSDFLGAIKHNSAALHALLAKAGYEYADGKLSIFIGNSFAAKKLDNAKYRQVMTAVALDFGIISEDIAIIPNKKPPSDAASAAVAAIMGGGEEVEFNAN